MKKLLLFTGTALSLLLITSKETFAQQAPAQIVSNTGVGYSTMFGIIIPDLIGVGNSSANIYSTSPTTESWSSIPAISETVDFGVGPKFSMGIGVAYQSGAATYTNYPNYNTGQADNFTETFKRVNYGARLLFHFGSSSKFDGYTGFRLGLSSWTINNNSNDPSFSDAKGSGTLPSFQYLIGFRIYPLPLPCLGFHMEFALGTPYAVEAGVSFKFGGV